MDWKIFYRITKYGLTLLLSVFFILSSCSKKESTSSNAELYKGFANINFSYVATDSTALGLSNEWFKFSNFPKSSFVSEESRSKAAYVWYASEFIVDSLDELQKYYLHINNSDKPMVWFNGHLIAPSQLENDRYDNIELPMLMAKMRNSLIIRQTSYKNITFSINNEKKIKEKITKDELISYKVSPSESIKDLMVYEIFLRNFTPNGTFDGLENKIPYFQNLGLNTIWLMPIHPIGEMNKQGEMGSPYSIKRHFSTNPDMGSKEQLKQLITTLHNNNIKVFIDAVVSYTARDHLLVYQKPEFYLRNEGGSLRIPNGISTRDVVALNYANSALRKQFSDYFNYWASEFSLDGFYCSNSESVPDEFWISTITELNKIKAGIGMVSDGKNKKDIQNGFDAVYGWDLYEVYKGIKDGSAKPSDIYECLEKERIDYGSESVLIHFSENHNTKKADELLGEDDHLLATFFNFTAPGIPLIYSGEEIKNSPYMELSEKTKINWRNQNKVLVRLIQDLAKLRESEKLLQNGDLLQLETAGSVAGFYRKDESRTLAVLGNYGDVIFSLPLNINKIIYSDKDTRWENGKIHLSPKGYVIAEIK